MAAHLGQDTSEKIDFLISELIKDNKSCSLWCNMCLKYGVKNNEETCLNQSLKKHWQSSTSVLKLQLSVFYVPCSCPRSSAQPPGGGADHILRGSVLCSCYSAPMRRTAWAPIPVPPQPTPIAGSSGSLPRSTTMVSLTSDPKPPERPGFGMTATGEGRITDS